MNRSSSISHFISETGTTQQVAVSLLEEHGWNVVQAVKTYQCRQKLRLGSNEPDPLPVVSSPSRPSTVAFNGDFCPETKEQEKNGRVDGLEKSAMLGSGSSALGVRLKRGMSNTSNNVHIMSIVHDLVLTGIKESAGVGSSDCQKDQVIIDTLNCTFILPDINHYPADFQAFLHKDLIETSTLISLEQAGRLNWWADIGACQRLLPLATTGDGNCLLHAASLGIWGFHDRRLTLRKALCHTLNESSAKGAFQRRWRWHQNKINKQSGLIYSEEEWTQEWENLLKLASPQPRKNGSTACNDSKDSEGEAEIFYESLEELHVFVLAHVLCRPIVIVADTILKDSNGDALAPISFGGIYLPLECDAADCYKTPLLLTYDAAHFSAIVPMEQSVNDNHSPPLVSAIPVVDPDFRLLPIHFSVDPGLDYSWESSSCADLTEEEGLELLRQYLNLETIPLPSRAATGDGKQVNGRAKAGSCGDLVRTPSLESDDNGFVVARAEKQPSSGPPEKSANKDTAEGEANTGEKPKVLPRTMQNMVRSFGSLGRSFRNRIKNIGQSGKTSSADTSPKAKSEQNGKQAKRAAGGSADRDRDHVLCARLQHRRQAFQEDMVKNYLKTALEKFESEQRAFAANVKDSSSWVQVLCVNANCDGLASASTSYLCQSCFERQRQDELGAEKGPAAPSRAKDSGSVSNAGAALDQAIVGGIDRVESGPVLPRYTVPQLPAAKSCAVPSGAPKTAANGKTAQILGSRPDGAVESTKLSSTLRTGSRPAAGHGDLTVYRENPPAAQGPTPWTNSPAKRPDPQPEQASSHRLPCSRDRALVDKSLPQKGGTAKSKTGLLDAKNFEKELESSLDDLQKSVVAAAPPSSSFDPNLRLTGSSAHVVAVNGCGAKFPKSFAVSGKNP